MQALVQCSQPLKNYLTRQFEGASDPRRRLMLEALTRRYYRIRELQGLRVVPVHGRVVAAAEYDHEGRRIHLLTTFAAYAELDRAAEAMVPLVADVPVDDDVVLDLYVWRPGPHARRRRDPRSGERGPGRGAVPPPAAPGGRRHQRARPGARHGRHPALHLSARTGGRLPGGGALPQPPSDDGEAAAAGAARQLPAGAAALGGGGRLPLPRHGARQSQRRAAVRRGGGARRHPRAGRGRRGGAAAEPRAQADAGGGRHPSLPGQAAASGATAT